MWEWFEAVLFRFLAVRFLVVVVLNVRVGAVNGTVAARVGEDFDRYVPNDLSGRGSQAGSQERKGQK